MSGWEYVTPVTLDNYDSVVSKSQFGQIQCIASDWGHSFRMVMVHRNSF